MEQKLKKLSTEQKKEAINMYANVGASLSTIAQHFEISIYDLIAQIRTEGKRKIAVNIHQSFLIAGQTYVVKKFVTEAGQTKVSQTKTTIHLEFVGVDEFKHTIEIPAQSFAESLATNERVKPLTKFIYVEGPMGGFEAFCAFNQDFDDEFIVTDFDCNNERIKVQGWNVEITEINDSMSLSLEY